MFENSFSVLICIRCQGLHSWHSCLAPDWVTLVSYQHMYWLQKCSSRVTFFTCFPCIIWHPSSFLFFYQLIHTSYLSQAQKNSVRCKTFQIERRKLHILHFLGLFAVMLWVFFVIFGCKILGLKNPASVREMTIMRYAFAIIT